MKTQKIKWVMLFLLGLFMLQGRTGRGGDTYYAALDLNVASKTGAGKVYAASDRQTQPKFESSSSSVTNESNSANSDLTFYRYASPDEDYNFVGWGESDNLDISDVAGQTSTNVTIKTAGTKNAVNVKTYYAYFKKQDPVNRVTNLSVLRGGAAQNLVCPGVCGPDDAIWSIEPIEGEKLVNLDVSREAGYKPTGTLTPLNVNFGKNTFVVKNDKDDHTWTVNVAVTGAVQEATYVCRTGGELPLNFEIVGDNAATWGVVTNRQTGTYLDVSTSSRTGKSFTVTLTGRSPTTTDLILTVTNNYASYPIKVTVKESPEDRESTFKLNVNASSANFVCPGVCGPEGAKWSFEAEPDARLVNALLDPTAAETPKVTLSSWNQLGKTSFVVTNNMDSHTWTVNVAVTGLVQQAQSCFMGADRQFTLSVLGDEATKWSVSDVDGSKLAVSPQSFTGSDFELTLNGKVEGSTSFTVKNDYATYKISVEITDKSWGLISYKGATIKYSAAGGYSFMDNNEPVIVFTNTAAVSTLRLPNKKIFTADILAIAGGGSGGTQAKLGQGGGGGGAGGFLYLENQQLIGIDYFVSVGAGATRKSEDFTGVWLGDQGDDSVITNAAGVLIAHAMGGGGGGASGDKAGGANGGSGGGGAWVGTTATPGGLSYGFGGGAQDGQGFPGGTPTVVGNAGGGGGAGTAGGVLGEAGEGKWCDITGENVLYSQGGVGGKRDLREAVTDAVGPGFGGDGGNGGHGAGGGAGVVVVRFHDAYENTILEYPAYTKDFQLTAIPTTYTSFSTNIAPWNTELWRDAVREVTGDYQVEDAYIDGGVTNGMGHYQFVIYLNEGYSWYDGSDYGSTDPYLCNWRAVADTNVVDATINLDKRVEWGEDGNTATINITSHSTPEQVNKTPKVLFLGTGCSRHGLKKETIIRSLNSIAQNADVDWYFLNAKYKGKDNSKNNIYGYIKKGATVGYNVDGSAATYKKDGTPIKTNPDLTKSDPWSALVLDAPNHHAFGEFLKTVYEHLEAIKSGQYQYIVFEFDGAKLIANPEGATYSWADYEELNYHQYAKDVAEALIPFYADKHVIWVVNKLGEAQTGTEFPNDPFSGDDYYTPSSFFSTGYGYGTMNALFYNESLALLDPKRYNPNFTGSEEPLYEGTTTYSESWNYIDNVYYSSAQSKSSQKIYYAEHNEMQKNYKEVAALYEFLATNIVSVAYDMVFHDCIQTNVGLTVEHIKTTIVTNGADYAEAKDIPESAWYNLCEWDKDWEGPKYYDTDLGITKNLSFEVTTNSVTVTLTNMNFNAWTRLQIFVRDDGTFQTSVNATYNPITGQWEKNPNQGMAHVGLVNPETGEESYAKGDAKTSVEWTFYTYDITANTVDLLNNPSGRAWINGFSHTNKIGVRRGNAANVDYRGDPGYEIVALFEDGSPLLLTDELRTHWGVEKIAGNHEIIAVYSNYVGEVSGEDKTIVYDGLVPVPTITVGDWTAGREVRYTYAYGDDETYYPYDDFTNHFAALKNVTTEPNEIRWAVEVVQPGWGEELSLPGYVQVFYGTNTTTITKRPLDVRAKYQYTGDEIENGCISANKATSWDDLKSNCNYILEKPEQIVAGETWDEIHTGTAVYKCPTFVAQTEGQYPIVLSGFLSDNYEIRHLPGVLSVGKGTFEIGGVPQVPGLDPETQETGVKSIVKVYDAESTNITVTVTVPKDKYTISYAAVNTIDAADVIGHDEILWSDENPTFTNASSNVVWYVVESTTDSFFPVTNYAHVVILPRPIWLESASDSWKFDGEEHKKDEVTVQAVDNLTWFDFLEKEPFAVHTVTRIRRVDSIDNRFAYEPVTPYAGWEKNYAFKETYGTLVVTPAPMEIGGITYPDTTDELLRPGPYPEENGVDWVDKVYDGQGTNITVTVTKPSEGYPLEIRYALAGTPDADWMTADEFSITDVYDGPVWFSIVDPAGNYVAVTNFSFVKISPRAVTVTATTDEKVYDGTPLTNSGFTTEPFAGDRGFVPGESLKSVAMTAESSQTAVGSCDNVIDPESVEPDENTKLSNYTFDFVPGKLTVTKLPITIQMNNYVKPHDGKPFEFDPTGFKVTAGSYAAGEGPFTFKPDGEAWSQTDVCEGILAQFQVSDGPTAKVANYDIKRLPGLMTIGNEAIYIGGYEQSEDFEPGSEKSGVEPVVVTYDGADHALSVVVDYPENYAIHFSTDNWATVLEGLAGNPSFKDVAYEESGALKTNLVWYAVEAENCRSVTNYSWVVIKPRAVEVTAKNVEITYRDDRPSFDETSYEISNGVDGDAFEVSLDYAKGPAFDYTPNTYEGEISTNAAIVVTRGGETITSDYKITFNKGNLTVNPAGIMADITSVEKEWDGNATNVVVETDSNYQVLYSLDGETWVETLGLSEVGTYTVYVMVTDPSGLYKDFIGEGTVKIARRRIKVTAKDVSRRVGEPDPNPWPIEVRYVDNDMLMSAADVEAIRDEIGVTLTSHEMVGFYEDAAVPYNKKEISNFIGEHFIVDEWIEGDLTITDRAIIPYEIEDYVGTFDGKGHTIRVRVTDANIPTNQIRFAWAFDKNGPWTTNLAQKVGAEGWWTGIEAVEVTNVTADAGRSVWFKIWVDESEDYAEVIDQGSVVITQGISPVEIGGKGPFDDERKPPKPDDPESTEDVAGTGVKNVVKLYDGEPTNLTVVVTSPEGIDPWYWDETSETWTREVPRFTDAGTNLVWYKVDEPYVAVVSNYAYVVIKPRSVTLETPTEEFTYTGEPQSTDEVTVSGDGFAAGEGLVTNKFATITTVAESPVENAFEYDLAEGVKASNYIITESWGTLTMKNAKFPEIDDEELSRYSMVTTYDGEAHTYNKSALETALAVLELSDLATITYSLTEAGPWVDTPFDFTDVVTTSFWYRVTAPNYDPFVHPVSVTINHKKITVTAEDKGRKVDQPDPEWTAKVEGLVEKDKPYEADLITYQVNCDHGEAVDTYPIIPSGDEIQGNYQVEYKNGTFTITEGDKPVYSVKPVETTYNGEFTNVLVDVVTPAGATVLFKDPSDGQFKTDFPGFKNVGHYTIEFKITCEGYDDAEGSSTVTINPKAVTVKAHDATKVYGEDDPIFTAEVVGLVEGEDESLIWYTISREPGNEVNTPYAINPTGAAEQGNYLVSFELGEFTITPAKLVYESPDVSAIYDGTGKSPEVTSEGATVTYYDEAGNPYDEKPAFTNAGVYTVVSVIEKEGYESVTITNTITVGKRPITLTTVDQSKSWDDEPLVGDKLQIGGSGYAKGEVFKYEFTTLDKIGKVTASFTVADNLATPTPTLLSNYDYQLFFGTLEITAASDQIQISSASDSWVYDGEAHGNSNYEVIHANLLAAGDQLVVTMDETKITYPGKVANGFSYCVMRDNEDVTAAYKNIIATTGTLEVVKASFKSDEVTADDIDALYNGESTNVTVKVSKNVENLKVLFSTDGETYSDSIPTFTHVTNALVWYVVQADYHNDYTSSVPAHVVIRPRALTFTSLDDIVMEGETATTDLKSIEVTGDGYAAGESFTFARPASRTEVGFEDATFAYAPADGTLATDYTITTAFGRLVVCAKNALTVIAGSTNFAFTGSAQSYHTYECRGLKEGDSLTAVTFSPASVITYPDESPVVNEILSIATAGKAEYTETNIYSGLLTMSYGKLAGVSAEDVYVTYDGAFYGIEVKKPEGATVTYARVDDLAQYTTENPQFRNASANPDEGYEVFYRVTMPGFEPVMGSARVYIARRPVTLVSPSEKQVYSGVAVSNGTVSVKTGAGLLSLAPGDVLTAATTVEQLNVGKVGNVFTYAITNPGYPGADLTKNYDFTTEPGLLEVTARTLSISTASETFAYTGSAQSAKTVTYGGDGFAAGEGVLTNGFASITTVAESPVKNVFEYALTKATRSANYLITTDWGLLTMTNALMPCALGDYTIVTNYDAEAHTFDTNALIKVVQDTDFKGNTPKIEYSLTGEDGDWVDEAFLFTDVTVTSFVYRVTCANYEPETHNVFVTINKRPVTVKITGATNETVYDSTEKVASGFTPTTDDKIYSVAYVKNNGTAEVKSTNVTPTPLPMGLTSEQFENTDANFAVTFDVTDGWLKINKAGIEIGGEGPFDPENMPTPDEAGDDDDSAGTGVQNVTKTYDGEATNVTVTVTKPETATVKFRVDGSDAWISEDDFAGFTDAGTNKVWYLVEDPNFETVSNYAWVVINPAPVRVKAKDATKVYGEDDPTFAAEVTGLVAGEDESLISYTITREKGEEVNTPYAIEPTGDVRQGNYTVSYEDATFIITPAELKVDAFDRVETYDGTGKTPDVTAADAKLTYYSESGDLFEGVPAFTNAGVYTVITVIEKSGFETVTVTNTVKINKRPITITTVSQKKTWDGTPLVSDKLTIGGSGYAPGEVFAYTYTNLCEVGICPAGLEIADNWATEPPTLISNYEITRGYGFLKIEARPDQIEIHSADGFWRYDGEAHSNPTYEITHNNLLVDGDEIVVKMDGTTITEPGLALNGFSYQVMRGEQDVTAAYKNIIASTGTLEVTNARFTQNQIKAEDIDYLYDGTSTNVTVTVDKDVEDLSILYSVDGENFAAEKPNFTHVTNAAVWYVVQAKYHDDFTSSIPVEVTIRPRAITLTSPDTIVMSGETATTDVANIQVTGDGFAENEGFDFVPTASRTEVGGEYATFDYSPKAGTDLNDYLITTEFGRLIVCPQDQITLIAANKQFTFNGKAQKCDEYEVRGLKEGDEVKGVTFAPESVLTYPDESPVANRILSVELTGAYDYVATNFVEGVLTMIPLKQTTVTAKGVSTIYDGEHYQIEVTAPAEAKITYATREDSAIWGANPSYRDANQEGYEVFYKVEQRGYETWIGSEKVIIARRPVTLASSSESRLYNGTILSNDCVTIKSGTMATGDLLDAHTTVELLNVGSTGNAFVYAVTNAAYVGVDLTKNYFFTTEPGTLEVKARQVKIVTEDKNFTYNGLSQSNAVVRIEGDGFIQDEGIKTNAFATITFVAQSPVNNTLDYTLVGRPENYIISTKWGVLTMGNAQQTPVDQGPNTSGPFKGPNTDEPLPSAADVLSDYSIVTNYDAEAHTFDTNALFAKLAETDFKGNTPVVEYSLSGAEGTWVSDPFAFTDVTATSFWYRVSVPNFDSEIHAVAVVVLPRPITVDVTGHTATKTYTGKEQSVTGYDLACTDKLYDEAQVSFAGSALAKGTDVNTYPMNLDTTKFSYNDKNFTATFNLTADGWLKIEKAGIEIGGEGPFDPENMPTPDEAGDDDDSAGTGVKNVTKTYDGEATNVTVTVTKPETATVKFRVDGSDAWISEDDFAGFTDAGTNKVWYLVEDPNFETISNYAWVVVLPRPITVDVTGHTATKTYTGKEQSVTGYDLDCADALYDQSKVVFTGSALAKGTDVNTYPMNLDTTKFSYNDKNFAATFNLTADGWLKIEKAGIEIGGEGPFDPENMPTPDEAGDDDDSAGTGVKNVTKTYDGEATNVTVTVTKPETATVKFRVDGTDEWIDEDKFAGFTDAGTNKVWYLVEDPNFETISNYAWVVVLPRPITVDVTGHTATKTYTGLEQSVTGYDLACTDKLYDEAQVSFAGEAIAKGTDVNTYPMNLDTTKFSYNDKNFTATFNLTADGWLKIEKAGVEIGGEGPFDPENMPTPDEAGDDDDSAGTGVKNVTKTYDGEATNVTVTVTKPETATVKFRVDGTDEWIDEDKFAGFTDAGTNKVWYLVEDPNFETISNYAWVVVLPRPITVDVTGHTGTKTYTGLEQSVTGYDLDCADALYDQSKVVFTGSAVAKGTDVNTYPMNLDTTKFSYNDKNFTATFNLIADGWLKIEKAGVEIGGEGPFDPENMPTPDEAGDDDDSAGTGVQNVTKTYDGEATNVTVTVTKPETATVKFRVDGTDEWIDEDKFAGFTDAGTNKVWYLVEDPNFETVSNYAWVVVLPRPITVDVTGHTATKTYTGFEQSVTGYDLACTDKLYDEAQVSFAGEAIAKGTTVNTYPMNLDTTKFSYNDKNFTATFNLIADGWLKIEKAGIEIGGEGPFDPENMPTPDEAGDDDDSAGTGVKNVTKTYDGEATNVTVTVTKPETATVKFRVDGSDAWISEDDFAGFTDAGTNKVWYLVEDPNFETVSNYAWVVVLPRPITVDVTGHTGTKTYTGLEQSVTGYDLACDDKLYDEAKVSFSGSAIAKGTDVNTYPMNLDTTKFSYNDKNFTATFNLTADGWLKIEKAGIEIGGKGPFDPENMPTPDEAGDDDDSAGTGVKNVTKTYDGVATNVTVTVTKPETATVKFRVDGSDAWISEDDFSGFTDAGTNKVWYLVEDPNFETVSNYAWVVVLPRPITVDVTGHTATKTYTGLEQSVMGYDLDCADALYDQSKVVFTGSALAKGTDVNTYPMNLDTTKFSYNDKNFAATFNLIADGWLKIEKSGIEIGGKGPFDPENMPTPDEAGDDDDSAGTGVKNVTKTYDGEATNVTVTVTKPETATVKFRVDGSDAWISEDDFAGFTDAGTNKVWYLVEDPNFETVSNYAWVVVLPRPITVDVTGHTGTKTYTGLEQSVTGYDLACNDKLYEEGKVVFTGSALAKGTDVNTYPMNLDTTKFSYNDKNFTATFNLTADGWLKIEKAGIEIGGEGPFDPENMPTPDEAGDDDDSAGTGVNNVTKTYDGEATNVTVTVTKPETATVKFRVDGTDEWIDEDDFAGFTDAGTNKVWYLVEDPNFETVSNYAWVVVLPRPITVDVTGHTGTKTYTGLEQSVTGYDLACEDALYDQSKVVFTGSAIAKGKDVDTYPMNLAVSQFSYNDKNFTATFNLIADGWLKIEKSSELGITIDNVIKEYDYELANISYQLKKLNPSDEVTVWFAPDMSIPDEDIVLESDEMKKSVKKLEVLGAMKSGMPDPASPRWSTTMPRFRLVCTTGDDIVENQKSYRVWVRLESKNYATLTTSGLVTIKPRPVFISFPLAEKVYDGTTDYDKAVEDILKGESDNMVLKEEFDALAQGHFKSKRITKDQEPEEDYFILDSIHIDPMTRETMFRNYIIKYRIGEKVYELVFDENGDLIAIIDPDGNRISIDDIGDLLTTVGQITKKVLPDPQDNPDPDDPNGYSIYINNITNKYGVKLPDPNDGANRWFASTGIKDETIEVTLGYDSEIGEMPNVGSYLDAIVNVSDIKVYDKDGDDVTDCYDIKVRKGTLVITSSEAAFTATIAWAYCSGTGTYFADLKVTSLYDAANVDYKPGSFRYIFMDRTIENQPKMRLWDTRKKKSLMDLGQHDAKFDAYAAFPLMDPILRKDFTTQYGPDKQAVGFVNGKVSTTDREGTPEMWLYRRINPTADNLAAVMGDSDKDAAFMGWLVWETASGETRAIPVAAGWTNTTPEKQFEEPVEVDTLAELDTFGITATKTAPLKLYVKAFTVASETAQGTIVARNAAGETGTPIEGTRVAVYARENLTGTSQKIGEFETDGTGRFSFPAEGPQKFYTFEITPTTKANIK